MGEVHLVYDRQEGREVALKAFPPDARRVEDLAHFEHEFLTLSRLRHPHVAEVYDFGVIEGSSDVFFTSEFIDGRDLFAESDDIAEERLATLMVQVCRGLEYVHSRRIIHYDVKPTNILVRRGEGGEQRVKLIDFGLAAEKVDDSLGIIKGTVSYLAPEVARHLPVDHRADLYSLGVTMFHCLTRRLPFKGETNLDVVRKVVSDAPPHPRELRADLSDGICEVILRLMEKEPGARYQSGNEVIRALAEIYGEDYAAEPREVMLRFVTTGGFFGREGEFESLTRAFDRIFSWRDEGDPAPPSGLAARERSGGSSNTATGFILASSDSFSLGISGSRPAAEPVGGSPLREPPRSLSEGLVDSVGSTWGDDPDSDPGSGGDPEAAAPPGAEGEADARPPAPLPHIHLVGGEAGVGKGRLLKEFKTYAQLRRVSVVEGKPSPTGRAYDAFVQVFRGILSLWHRDPDESAQAAPLRPSQNDPLRRRLLNRYGAEMARLIPELDSSALPITARAQLAPEQEEVRLLDALAQFLIGYSRNRPLVVLLHNLEEADVQTVELLHYLARNLSLIESTRALASRTPGARQPRPLRLQVVVSYRPSELEAQGLAGAIDPVADASITHAVQLAPLGPGEVYHLVESMLGVGSQPRRLAERIYGETKGNPYFTVELMRALVESGTLSYVDGEWVARLEEGGVPVPESVAGVILERTRQIAAEERGPLRLLAVLGRPASIHELAALTHEDVRSLVAGLEELVKRQVLHSDVGEGGRRYEFIHGLARDAIYEDIPPAQRTALHAACGEYLEQRAELGTGAVDLGELVRHFSAAGDRTRALDYGVRAGDEARAVHANHRAIGFYSGALSLLPIGSGRWRGLLLGMGELLALIGDYDRAVEVYDRLLGTAPEKLAPRERARASRHRGEVLARRGDLDAALEALSQAAFTTMGEDGLERESAALFAVTAAVYCRAGRFTDAIGFCEAGLAQLRGLSEGDEEAEVRSVLGRARLALGDLSAAEAEFERCLAVRRRQGDEAGVARALADLGEVALETGRLEDAASRFERAMERETALGHVAGQAEAARRLARACRELGHHERALSLLRQALSTHEKTGAVAEAVHVLTDLARVHLSIGDYESAEDHVRRARGDAERLGLLAEAARAQNAEAALRLLLNDVDRAAALATEALRQASLQGDLPRERARALETLGACELTRGEHDRAEHLLHEAQALFRAQKDPSGVVRTTVAVCAIFLARRDQELARATLETLGKDVPRADRGRVLLTRVQAALAFDAEVSSALLGELERAMGWADQYRDLELGWRIEMTRARTMCRLGDEESALEAYANAMTWIRDLRDRVPDAAAGAYLEHPDRLACRREFSALRGRLLQGR